MCHLPLPNLDSNSLVQPQREPVSLEALWQWVDHEVAEQVTAQNVFTAYSITKLLRARHPEYEIVHYYVNIRVHLIMEIVNHYAMTWQNWNGEAARTYAPLCVVSKSSEKSVLPSVIPVRTSEPARLAPVSVRINWEEDDH